MSFGERLKSILSERKIKLSQLCRDTGISYNTMQSIIKRNTDIMNVSVQIPIEISKYLEIDFYELVGKEAAAKMQKEKPIATGDDGLGKQAQRIGQAYEKATRHDQITVEHVLEPYMGESSYTEQEYSAEPESAPEPERRMLSIKEQAELLRARADALEKGRAEYTIFEKDA